MSASGTLSKIALACGLLTACESATLPPEAFGRFVEGNGQAFRKQLEVRADGITLFIGVSPLGGSGRTLECRGPAPDGVKATMSLPLSCDGESIPFELTFRSDKTDWVVIEDGSAPEIFTRGN
jgi:hypothetical protein